MNIFKRGKPMGLVACFNDNALLKLEIGPVSGDPANIYWKDNVPAKDIWFSRVST